VVKTSLPQERERIEREARSALVRCRAPTHSPLAFFSPKLDDITLPDFKEETRETAS
jgi:hypothetical protein